jgi:hypothetical protein
MNKSIVLALIAGAATLAAVPAHAGNVFWSVGIDLPVPRFVLPVPVYAPAPVYAPEPVYYQRQPVYAPEPVYYQRQPVYVRPAPVAHPRYYYPGWHHEHRERERDHDHDHDRWEGGSWHRD